MNSSALRFLQDTRLAMESSSNRVAIAENWRHAESCDGPGVERSGQLPNNTLPQDYDDDTKSIAAGNVRLDKGCSQHPRRRFDQHDPS